VGQPVSVSIPCVTNTVKGTPNIETGGVNPDIDIEIDEEDVDMQPAGRTLKLLCKPLKQSL
jgi:hypothetical protein